MAGGRQQRDDTEDHGVVVSIVIGQPQAGAGAGVESSPVAAAWPAGEDGACNPDSMQHASAPLRSPSRRTSGSGGGAVPPSPGTGGARGPASPRGIPPAVGRADASTDDFLAAAQAAAALAAAAAAGGDAFSRTARASATSGDGSGTEGSGGTIELQPVQLVQAVSRRVLGAFRGRGALPAGALDRDSVSEGPSVVQLPGSVEAASLSATGRRGVVAAGGRTDGRGPSSSSNSSSTLTGTSQVQQAAAQAAMVNPVNGAGNAVQPGATAADGSSTSSAGRQGLAPAFPARTVNVYAYAGSREASSGGAAGQDAFSANNERNV